ncbi:YvrJ family protein [Solibacillus sp. FSL K6-4121]|uniref:YvrJ family protein n=1 Tax=Solibacillus sp. FSL K6-4121 TaxID=2921505 RepID=UPI0030F92B26
MIEGQLFQILGNFGFPITIAIYLLMRFEGKIDSLRSSIDVLSNDLTKVNHERTKK